MREGEPSREEESIKRVRKGRQGFSESTLSFCSHPPTAIPRKDSPRTTCAFPVVPRCTRFPKRGGK